MSGVPLRNIVKHLTCTVRAQLPRLTHRLLHRLPPSLSSPTSQLITSTQQWRLCSTSASLSPPSSSKDTSLPPYLSALIKCRKDVADPLSEALLCFGASSVSMDDHEDYENSDEVSICTIFTGCGDVDICISRAADSVGMEMPTFELLKYNPYDWIKRTQDSFDPVEITKGLWVVPEWKTPPDSSATNIIVNPGLAFGTGEHATTKLCLLLLHQTVRGGELFLDYGTGSGILSIAALKLGAAQSVGVDIDPQAIKAACQNAGLNNVGPDSLKVHLIPTEDTSFLSDEGKNENLNIEEFVADEDFLNKDQYDIVIANILMNPLLEFADEIVSHAKAGAIVGLSGILHDQVPSVIGRYSQFLEEISVAHMEDWACIKGTKKRGI